MFATVLASLFLGLAAPQAPVVTFALHGNGGDAVAVRGSTELSAAAAYDAARDEALAHVRTRWTERGARLAEQQRPFWLPAVFVDRAVSRWLGQQSLDRHLQIVDREDRVREHEFGRSYQTTLWIRENPEVVAHGERQLRRAIARSGERTLVLGGATAGFWAVLALALGWIDRLSRGYMTGRLRCIGVLLGAAVPAVAFLL
ncbi:MAG: hypothetical protein AB7O97_11540 [Planctomycetota bacterium]